jgi:hypothetical protein
MEIWFQRNLLSTINMTEWRYRDSQKSNYLTMRDANYMDTLRSIVFQETSTSLHMLIMISSLVWVLRDSDLITRITLIISHSEKCKISTSSRIYSRINNSKVLSMVLISKYPLMNREIHKHLKLISTLLLYLHTIKTSLETYTEYTSLLKTIT